MAFQNGQKNKPVKTTATGNGKDTGTPVSVAPTKRPPDFDKDFTYGRQSYGANAYGGASSLPPGGKERASLTVNNDDDDEVLNAIKQKGSAAMSVSPTGDAVTATEGVTGSQLRDIADKNVPDHPAMASARSRQPSYPGPAGVVPATLTDDNEQPVRKPGA
jgi:hypothetical protein